jgi:hypothetical protein
MIDRFLVVLVAANLAFAGLIVSESAWTGADHSAIEPAPPPAEAKPKPRAPAPEAVDLMATTLAAPLFNATRRPPEQAGASTPTDLPNLRLTGVVVEPDRRIAIFAVAGAKPIVRAQGEAIDDWRLDSVSLQTVSLSGPAGTRTLEPKPDQNLVRPRQPTPVAGPAKLGGFPAQPAAATQTRAAPQAPLPGTIRQQPRARLTMPDGVLRSP